MELTQTHLGSSYKKPYWNNENFLLPKSHTSLTHYNTTPDILPFPKSYSSLRSIY